MRDKSRERPGPSENQARLQRANAGSLPCFKKVYTEKNLGFMKMFIKELPLYDELSRFLSTRFARTTDGYIERRKILAPRLPSPWPFYDGCLHNITGNYL